MRLHTAIIIRCILPLPALVACGGPATFDLAPRSAEDTIDNAPRWMMEVPRDDHHLTAAATSTSRDFQIAVDKARSAAQIDIAQQLGAHMANLTKQFQEEVGMAVDSQLLTEFSSATKAVVDETLVGARVVKRRLMPERNVYRAYVLMQLPIGEANTVLLRKLKSDEALYTRFRASRAYAELDEQVRRHSETAGH